jgi:two-component system cell cycle sensor histidine kinase/response regulator CckA
MQDLPKDPLAPATPPRERLAPNPPAQRNHQTSDRESAEDASAAKLRLLDKIVNTSPDLIYIYDLVEHRNVYANQETLAFLGYDPQSIEADGASLLSNVIHPDDLARIEENHRQFATASDDEVRSIEYRLKDAGGRWRWTRSRDTVFARDAQGRPCQIVGVAEDITDRHQAEEAVQRSEELFRRTFDLSPAGMVLVGLDFRLVRCNRAYCRFLGYTEGELIGRTFLEVTHPEDREIGLTEIRGLLAGDVDRAQVVKRYLRKDGGVVWGELTMTVMRDSARRALFFLTVVSDITERKRAELERARLEDQIRQAQKMESIGRLAGGVAHDFNNMLQAILGNVDFALTAAPPDGPLREYLGEIRKSAERSADLTRQLLAFARRQTISPKVLDLNDTVGGMLKMLHRLIGENLQLRWIPGPRVWPVKVDPSQVDQILANLTVNARDAIDGSGCVTLETRNAVLSADDVPEHAECAPGEYVALVVSDTGRGLTAEARAHLFEPFFTTKEPGRGTGLGLSTVFGIMRQNNGFIDVHSEPGHGTTFRLYFPRAEAEGPVVKAPPALKASGGTETILLVEDEEQVLALGRQILEKAGYSVLAAPTPAAGLELAARCPGTIHILVSDVVMPDMNGSELLARLRPAHPGMKCLFMSGYTADVIADHGVLDDAIQFLQKPFTASALSEKVRQVLDAG